MIKNNKKNNGFTLIEIAIAITILGLAMTTIIGLQTRYVNNYMVERDRTKAALIAQYIMTSIEVEKEPPEKGEKKESLNSVLKKIHYFENLDSKDKKQEKKYLRNWTLTKKVTSIDIHLIKDVLRRVDLKIKWGKSEDSSFTLTYYIKTNK